MVVSYSGKHMDVSDEMKDYLEKKLKKIKFYFEQIINITVIVEQERGKFNAEVKVAANQDTYFAKENSGTWQVSFDKVVDKIEKEIKKKKEKLKDHHK